jgi:hypothetical protein
MRVCLQILLNILGNFSRCGRREVSLHHIPFLVYQELAEVPLHIAGEQSSLLLLQELVQRAGCTFIMLVTGQLYVS